MQKLVLKRGDTLSWTVAAADDNGNPVDLTNWLVRSQLRQGPTLVDTLVFVPSNISAGVFILNSGDVGTSAYPVGALACDIEYMSPTGVITSTETFAVQVLADVTQ